MKRKIHLVAPLIFCTLHLAAQETADTSARKGPVIKFEKMEISDTVYITKTNTAMLKDKDHKYAEFRFKNTGDEPLLIERVTQSQPCFTGEWPRKPIEPGEEGVIKVTCPGKPEGKEMVMGFTVTTNDPTGIKLLVLKRSFIDCNQAK
jgi:hypothetical protein